MAKFGTVRKLPSGRFQARYTGPDGKRYSGTTDEGRPLTFSTEGYASAYLTRVHADIQRDKWEPPRKSVPEVQDSLTFGTYATAWLANREIADRTRADYQRLLDAHIVPTFGNTTMVGISPAMVRAWHAGLLRNPNRPTLRAHAYGLLRTIMNTAVADEVIAANPCRVRGAGQTKRVKQIRPASVPELEAIASSVPERYRLMVLLAAWCAMRFGELAELRRSDVDVKNGVIHVRRGVVRLKGERVVKGPKSDAGRRDINIPPHLMPLVKSHLRDHVAVRRDALMFPARSGGHMSPSALQKVFYPARKKAGREDLRFHDLRHSGAVFAALSGATLAELMGRLGHSTASAALRYQHVAQDRDKAIAAALSELAGGTVVPIKAAKSS